MDLEKIKAFIELAKREGVSKLSYECEDEKLSVSLPIEGQLKISRPFDVLAGESLPSASKEHKAAKLEDSSIREVRSPFVGTFYSSPSPSDPPYAKVGDRVNSGQILCILEAMKIMNEIESDVSGTIAKICVENESLVEYGQVLFQVKV